MAYLYDYTNDQHITNIVESCEPVNEVIKIQQYSPSGKAYIQVLGSPRTSYDVSCAVTREQKEFLERAEAEGNLLQIGMSHGVYWGYISELRFSALPEDYFSVDMSLLVGVPTFKEGTKVGEEIVLVEKTITQNGIFTPAEGEDGFSKVTVNCSPPPPTESNFEKKTVNINQNGDFLIQPTSHDPPYWGLEWVRIHALVTPNLENRNATVVNNGRYSYTPSPNKDGIGNMTIDVRVPGPDLEAKTVKYTTNGTRNITPSAGKDGLQSVSVEVDVPGPDLETKSVKYTTNGTHNITPSSGKDGLQSISVEVDVPTDADLESKSDRITKNGSYTYHPSQNKDGLSEVALRVDVPGPDLETRIDRITANGQYTYTSDKDGFSEVHIDVDVAKSYPELRPLHQIIRKNGIETFTPSAGYDGFSEVEIRTEVGNNQQRKEITVTANGQIEVVPDENYDGIDKIIINTHVEGTPDIQTNKTATVGAGAAVIVTPDEGYVGMSQVLVSCPTEDIILEPPVGRWYSIPINKSVGRISGFIAKPAPNVRAHTIQLTAADIEQLLNGASFELTPVPNIDGWSSVTLVGPGG